MSLMYFFKPESWPIFNANSGDLDLIGNRKAASFYQAVVWRNSPIEMLVHQPLPEGKKELRSPWGFPDELKSWTWPGQEGKKIGVNVYTRSKLVKLELNGKIIAEQTAVTKKLITGVFIFVAGIIINELLLMVQGVAALTYNSIPYINILLLMAAITLFAGISVMFISCLKTPAIPKLK